MVYGPPHEGKTALAVRLAERLAELGLAVGGFFQQAVTDQLDRRGYDLVRFADRRQVVPLARPARAGDMAAICSFVFRPDAIARGANWLREDAGWADVLLIDEVSKLELMGSGHCETVRWALTLAREKVVILSIRADQLAAAAEQFEITEHLLGYLELPVTGRQIEELVQSLVSGRSIEVTPP